MFDKKLLAKGGNVTEQDLANTPPPVLELLFSLVEEVARLNKRVEELEARLNQDSSNSNKPPSSNSPYRENEPKKKRRARKKKRGGCRQKLMDPTETRKIFPSTCSCGCTTFKDTEPYYTHQHIELPEMGALRVCTKILAFTPASGYRYLP